MSTRESLVPSRSNTPRIKLDTMPMLALLARAGVKSAPNEGQGARFREMQSWAAMRPGRGRAWLCADQTQPVRGQPDGLRVPVVLV